MELFVHDPLDQPGPSPRCASPLCRNLLDAIGSARRTIDFAIYGLRSQPEILDALAAARRRGVRLRGVVDADVEGGNPYRDTGLLRERLPEVRTDQEADRRERERQASAPRSPARDSGCARPPGTAGPLSCFDVVVGGRRLRAAQASLEPVEFRGHILHHKFFVIDGHTVWTGSANLSDTDTGGYNANVAVLLRGIGVAGRFTHEFERLWSEGRFHDRDPATRGSRSGSEVAGGPGSGGPGTVQVWFSPQDRPVDRALLPLIRSARDTIRVAIFFLTSKRIATALLEARARGVDVRILLDATGAANAYSKHPLLREAGLAVKVENFGGKMHAKAASFDGRDLLVGSMNWTAAGESSNDENVVVVRGAPDLAGEFERVFEQMWARVPARWLSADPVAESPDSPPSCADGVDDDHDGLVDAEDPGCRAPASTAPTPWVVP